MINICLTDIVVRIFLVKNMLRQFYEKESAAVLIIVDILKIISERETGDVL